MAARAHFRLLAILALAAAAAAAGAETAALLPVERAARRPEVEGRVELALAAQLAARVELVGMEQTRDALRRRRLRSSDGADGETLRALATELAASWLLAATVHEAPNGPVPELTISARLYDGGTGELVWCGFVGASGIDDAGLLGIGRFETHDQLADHAVAELLAPLFANGAGLTVPAVAARQERLGTVAIVPFTATVGEDALEVSVAATESLRAILHRRGVRLAEPGCVRAGLRRATGHRWGELSAEARAAIRASCGAELLVTGSVERWELGGSAVAPEPTLAVAVRLLEAAGGRIRFTGSLEAGGWDRPGLFGLRRVYARGELLNRLLDRIGKNLLAVDLDTATAMESSS